MNVELGKRIKARRKELHLTLEDVSNICGVVKTTVRNWELGYVDGIKTSKIELLCKALHVDPLFFIDCKEIDPYANITDIDKEIFDNVLKLSLKQKIEVGAYIYKLLEESK